MRKIILFSLLLTLSSNIKAQNYFGILMNEGHSANIGVHANPHLGAHAGYLHNHLILN